MSECSLTQTVATEIYQPAGLPPQAITSLGPVTHSVRSTTSLTSPCSQAPLPSVCVVVRVASLRRVTPALSCCAAHSQSHSAEGASPTRRIQKCNQQQLVSLSWLIMTHRLPHMLNMVSGSLVRVAEPVLLTSFVNHFLGFGIVRKRTLRSTCVVVLRSPPGRLAVLRRVT